MWDNNDYSMSANGDTGGGFFNNSTVDSPGTDKKKGQAKRAQSITPVVVGMLKNNPDDEFMMWGSPTSILKLVCIVRKFDVTSTTVTYELEDHTGRINALLWLEHDSSQQPEIPVDKENIYVRVFGTLRVKENEKLIMILKIAPIDKLNEITSHILETIYVRVKYEKISKGEMMAIKANNPGAELSNSMMNFAGGMAIEEDGMTPLQKKVYNIIKSAKTEVGISVSAIMKHFEPKQEKDIRNEIEFFVSEGHVFSTVDNDHFQVTYT